MSFLGTYNLSGDLRAILLAIINGHLGQSYTLDDFELSVPEAAPAGSPGNTLVHLTPEAKSGNYGDRKVYYDRINLADYGEVKIVNTSATTMHPLLSAINAKLGIGLTAQYVVNSALTADDDQRVGTLTVTADCPIFYGSTTVNTITTTPAPTPAPTPPPYLAGGEWEETNW